MRHSIILNYNISIFRQITQQNAIRIILINSFIELCIFCICSPFTHINVTYNYYKSKYNICKFIAIVIRYAKEKNFDNFIAYFYLKYINIIIYNNFSIIRFMVCSYRKSLKPLHYNCLVFT